VAAAILALAMLTAREDVGALGIEAEVERAKAAGTYEETERSKPRRPKGSKDSEPRKRRNDAGIKRESWAKAADRAES
jgi:hypothetical protein